MSLPSLQNSQLSITMEMQCVWVFFVLSWMTVSYAQLRNVTVSAPAGTFIGFKQAVDVDGSTVQLLKFLGIPYAEPPIGDQRFEKPVAKATMSEPFIAYEHGSVCIQVGLEGDPREVSEDCLFLNVYAPDTARSSGPLAVMIWIHGGAYILGSSNIYIGDHLAARGNVVLVTINYRLSILGFLNVGGGRPSNFGLWDQHMAIKWVRDNIEAFGGDKDSITIFGESAGAGSVIHQGIFPGNRGLFQRIIAESGTASSPWSEALNPLAEAVEFANIVGCRNRSTNALFECLQQLPSAVISATLNDFTNSLLRNPVPFVPSVDNDFIRMHPKEILNAKYNMAANERDVFSTFELLIGTNSAEGSAYLTPLFGFDSNPENFLPNRTRYEESLIPLFISQNVLGKDEHVLVKLLAGTYSTWDDPENPHNIRDDFVDMNGDYYFLVPTLLTTELYAQLSTIGAYLYYFDVKPSIHLYPAPSWVDGLNHADELIYVFGEVKEFGKQTVIDTYPQWEQELSKNIMTMWSNFAKTGNPNQPNDIGVNWQPYTKTNKRYLDIRRFLNETGTKDNLILDRVYLWDQMIPAMNEASDRAMLSCDVSGAKNAKLHKASMCIVFVLSLLF